MPFTDYRVFDFFNFVSIDRKIILYISHIPFFFKPKTKKILIPIIEMCCANCNQLLMLIRSHKSYKKEV